MFQKRNLKGQYCNPSQFFLVLALPFMPVLIRVSPYIHTLVVSQGFEQSLHEYFEVPLCSSFYLLGFPP